MDNLQKDILKEMNYLKKQLEMLNKNNYCKSVQQTMSYIEVKLEELRSKLEKSISNPF